MVTVGGEVPERDQLVLHAQMLAEHLGELLPGCLVQWQLRVNRLHRAIDVFGQWALDILQHGVLELGLGALVALGCGFLLSQSARALPPNQARQCEKEQATPSQGSSPPGRLSRGSGRDQCRVGNLRDLQIRLGPDPDPARKRSSRSRDLSRRWRRDSLRSEITRNPMPDYRNELLRSQAVAGHRRPHHPAPPPLFKLSRIKWKIARRSYRRRCSILKRASSKQLGRNHSRIDCTVLVRGPVFT